MFLKQLTCTLLITQLAGVVLGRDFFSEEYNTIINEFDDGYYEQTNKNKDFAAFPNMMNQISGQKSNPIITSNIDETSNIEPPDDVLARHRHHLDVLNKLRDMTSQLKDNLRSEHPESKFIKPERFKKSDPNYVHITQYYKGSNPHDDLENTLDKFSRDTDPNEYNDYEDVLNIAEKKELTNMKQPSLDIPMMLVKHLLDRKKIELVEPLDYSTMPLFPPCHHGKTPVVKYSNPLIFLKNSEEQPNFENPEEAQPKISRNGKDLTISKLFENNTDYAINVKLKVDIDIPQLNNDFRLHNNKEKSALGLLGNHDLAVSPNSMDLYPSLITIPFPFFQLTDAFNSSGSHLNVKTSTSKKGWKNVSFLPKRNSIHKKKKVKLNTKVKHNNKRMNTKVNVIQSSDFNVTTSMVLPNNESKKEIQENEIPISTEKVYKIDGKNNLIRLIKEVNLKREHFYPNATDLKSNLTVPMILGKKEDQINETDLNNFNTTSYSDKTILVNHLEEKMNSSNRDQVILRTNILRKKRSLEKLPLVSNLTESNFYAAKNNENLSETISDNVTVFTIPTETMSIENITKIEEKKLAKVEESKNNKNENKNQTKQKLKDSETSLNKNKPLLFANTAKLNPNMTLNNLTDQEYKNTSTVTSSHIKKDIPKSNIWEIIVDEKRENSSIILKNSESLDRDILHWSSISKSNNQSRSRRDLPLENHPMKKSSSPKRNRMDLGMFGEVNWTDVDTIAPAFMSFMGKYMSGVLTLCSDVTCHSMKCEHRQCLHRWCSPKERENKTGHCNHNKDNKGNSESMTTLEELDVPTKTVIALVDVLERKISDKLFGKVTICSSHNCITILADGKQFHKFRCAKKKLDRKEHCIEAKKILKSKM